ncbi:MAG TPA: replication protein, partial [Gemmatimonadaceae bacterium]
MSNRTDDTPFEYEGFSNPNGTIVPDDVFDVLMPRLADAELRILLYIIRRTFGFKKNSDDISLRQMVEGITTRDGRVLDSGTGLSKPTVARGLAGLREKRIIVATRNRSAQRGNEATSYRLRFKGETDAATDVAGDPRENPGRTPLSHQRDKGLSHDRDKGLSHQRDIQQTGKQQTEISLSKSSKSTRSKNGFVDNSPSQWISSEREPSIPQRSATTRHGVEGVATIMARSA